MADACRGSRSEAPGSHGSPIGGRPRPRCGHWYARQCGMAMPQRLGAIARTSRRSTARSGALWHALARSGTLSQVYTASGLVPSITSMRGQRSRRPSKLRTPHDTCPNRPAPYALGTTPARLHHPCTCTVVRLPLVVDPAPALSPDERGPATERYRCNTTNTAHGGGEARSTCAADIRDTSRAAVDGRRQEGDAARGAMKVRAWCFGGLREAAHEEP